MSVNEDLVRKYRPTSFDEIIGQKSVHVFLSRMIKDNKVPNALLFYGPSGVGRTSAAKVFAASLNCDELNKPCSECENCRDIFEGIAPKLLSLDANEPSIDIGKVTNNLIYNNTNQVVLIENAHNLSKGNFSVLLKQIETHNTKAIFILSTTEYRTIPESIVTRCVGFSFSRLNLPNIIDRLSEIVQKENIKASDELLQLIASQSKGSMRAAITKLDSIIRAGISEVDEFIEFTGQVDFGADLLKAITTGNQGQAYKVLSDSLMRIGNADQLIGNLIETVNDILLLNSGVDIERYDKELEDRQILLEFITYEQAIKMLTIIWDLRTKVRVISDTAEMLSVAISIMTAMFTVVPKESRKLTLAQMKELESTI